MDHTRIIIYPLGTGGWIPANGLETMCFAFFHDDEIFILDAGSGIARLLELKESIFKHRWPGIKRARIFLTHYHLDHIAGLFWVRAIFKGIPVSVYAPGKSVYGAPALEILNDLFRKPFSPRPFLELIDELEVEDLDPPALEINLNSHQMKIGVKLNSQHSDPSVSLRFNDWFAFVTDTPPENETIEFVRGVKVLLHESYFSSTDRIHSDNDELVTHAGGPHTGNFGAGLIAKRAGVDRLYLIHHNPEIPILETEAGAKKVTSNLGLDCRVSRDLEEIVIDI